MTKTKKICYIVSIIFFSLFTLIVLNFTYYPYATANKYSLASSQGQALFEIAFERCLGCVANNDFDNIKQNFSKKDVWGNSIFIKKTDDGEIVFRSFGLNGIDDGGNYDDITVTIKVEDGTIEKTNRHIPGRSFFKYWELYEWLFTPHESYNPICPN